MTTRLLVSLLGIVAITAMAEEPTSANTKKAIFAGGCFWCIQTPYDSAKGVVKTIVGYTGGSAEDATYEKVSSHRTKHREAIEVTYDPAQISYDQLLDIFWRNIDPTQADGQFHDIGPNYQAAVYYGNDEEKKAAEGPAEEPPPAEEPAAPEEPAAQEEPAAEETPSDEPAAEETAEAPEASEETEPAAEPAEEEKEAE